LKAVLLLPFTYFYSTRLSKGALAFHVLFEWVAAIWLVTWLSTSHLGMDLIKVVLSYLAFISVYELGYMANDLHAAKFEADGRRRGPQDATSSWVIAWVLTRLMVFFGVTVLLQQWSQVGWWLFYIALGTVFALHNWLDDREMKVSTFAWLAWFRFMAPVIFVVGDSDRMGVGLAAAMGYVMFRQLGYMDSKGLLQMPGRQRPLFRRFFFLMPLIGAAALLPYPEAKGYVLITVYWAVIAFAGTLGALRGSR